MRLAPKPRFACLLTLALLAAPALSAQEGGIELFAANTLFDEGTRVTVSHVYRKKGTLFDGSDDTSDPLDRTFEEHRFVTVIDHGLRPDLTVSALLPVVTKKLDSDAGDVDSTGLGDLALIAKLRLHKRDWPRSSWNVSVFAGIETPTGDTHERDRGARLPTDLQPGLGAWNPFVGLASNVSLDRLRFDGVAFFKQNTAGAQDFEKGDFFSLELDAAYRFLHTRYPGPTASGKLGLQWRHEGHADLDGARVTDSGSDELLVRTGLTWHPRPGIDFSVTVDLPLYQDYEGQQLGLDVRTFVGLGIRF